MMDREAKDHMKQATDIGSFQLLTKDGSKVYIRNGGVDGLIDVIIIRNVPKDAVWLLQGHVNGVFTVPGTAVDEIRLNGEYYLYGNTDNGNVLIVDADDFSNDLLK